MHSHTHTHTHITHTHTYTHTHTHINIHAHTNTLFLQSDSNHTFLLTLVHTSIFEPILFCYSGAMYICTEGAFPNKRLHQMAQHFSQQHASTTRHRFTDCIWLEHVADIVSSSLCFDISLSVFLYICHSFLSFLLSSSFLLLCFHQFFGCLL